MKLLLATLAGFTVSMGMFAGGAALATYTLAAKPSLDQAGLMQDTTALWSAEPRRVVADEQEFTRIDPATPPVDDLAVKQQSAQSADVVEVAMASADGSQWPEGSLDHTATNAIGATDTSQTDSPMQDERLQLSEAHIAWCANRYRSYQPATNSYRPYSGGQKECVSPHLRGADRNAGTMVAQANAANVTSDLQNTSNSRDARACANRYRSYRASDNSYQPYGGGARRQCTL
jgi:hypothetical protein